MRRILTFVVVLMAAVTVAPPAQATVVQYMSQHPLPRKLGGGFCYIDVAHVHDFGPSDSRMYRQVDGQLYFVGDPTPFDYQGPRYAYYGAHPVAEGHFGQPVYCYLQGPHYHWYQPSAQASFQLRGGAYWFTGTYEPVYYDQRPRYVVVNEAYAPIVYSRPVVDVTVAPPGFHGELVGGGPGWRGRAVVGAPVVSAGVYVAPPPPPPVLQVGVGINLGGPVVMGGSQPVVIDRGHDHGRHRGWNKHGHERGWRGPPPAPSPRGGGWRGGPPAPPPSRQQSGGWRGGPPPQQGAGWRGNPSPPPPRGGGGKPGGWHR